LNYRDAVSLVKERAVVKYGGKQGLLLTYLVERLFPGKNKNKDISYIERRIKVSKLQSKLNFISERHLRRLLDDLNDVVTLDWNDGVITYKVNLGPLSQFDYDAALNEKTQQLETKRQQRNEYQADLMRQRRATKNQEKETEKLLKFLKQQPEQMTIGELIGSIEHDKQARRDLRQV
jgi:hypothetical protein